MTENFSASRAPRLMQCAASGNLDVAIPSWVPPVVDENAGAKGKGTAIHALLEEAASYNATDMEHIAAAIQYVAEVRRRRRFKVEREFKMTADWLPSKPTTTVDLVLYVQDELHIIDHKTGRIPVEVVDNEQLLFYAVTAAQYFAPKAKGVTIHVNQPWAGIQAKWFADTNVLADFMDRAQAAEAKVQSKTIEFGPSDHCLFCPANPHSRGDKGSPLCPVMLDVLYPKKVDEDAILSELS